MLMNYHIGRLVLSSLCVGAFGAAGFEWCSFCGLKPANTQAEACIYIYKGKGKGKVIPLQARCGPEGG